MQIVIWFELYRCLNELLYQTNKNVDYLELEPKNTGIVITFRIWVIERKESILVVIRDDRLLKVLLLGRPDGAADYRLLPAIDALLHCTALNCTAPHFTALH